MDSILASRPRLILVGAALVLLLGLAAFIARPLAQRWLESTQPVAVGGRLLLPAETGLVVYDLERRHMTPLVTTGQGEIVSSAAWSPDGASVAYGFFHRRPGDPASVSEIYLVSADGSGPRALAERDRPGSILDMPSWSPDGREVFFAFIGQVGGRYVQRIERVSIETGERQTVVENGYAPSVSRDGRSLLFLRDERAGVGLWMTSLAGGEPTAVLPPGRYPSLAAPRWSPDGSKVAAAVVNVGQAGIGHSGLLASLLPTAYAHGDPWDIWTFDLGSNNARRLTEINADEPSPVWSPDGRYIAFWGGSGLYVVAQDGSYLQRVIDTGGYGGIDWAP